MRRATRGPVNESAGCRARTPRQRPRGPKRFINPSPCPRPRTGMSKEQMEIRELKEGRYMLIDDEPCKIDSIEKSKPGKHGASKARIEARSIFTNAKKTYLGSVTDKVWVPQVDRRAGQLLSFHGGVAQIMDRDTFETFELP